MDIRAKAKEIGDLIKKYNDIELYQRIVALNADIVELSNRNFTVEAELREANEKLAMRHKLVFKPPYFYIDGDDHPFCPRCCQGPNERAVRLSEVRGKDGTRDYRRCPVCDVRFDEGEPRGPSRRAVRRKPHGWMG